MLLATLRLALTPDAMLHFAGGASQQQQQQPGLGTARRLSVAHRRQQAALMRDVLCHAPDVILVADIATAEVGMAADPSFVVLCAGMHCGWVHKRALQ
jgi:stage III sporulation protein SpoIIIAA